jgi:hypothetical protein
LKTFRTFKTRSEQGIQISLGTAQNLIRLAGALAALANVVSVRLESVSSSNQSSAARLVCIFLPMAPFPDVGHRLINQEVGRPWHLWFIYFVAST